MTSKATPAAWQLFYFKLFKEALDELEQTVTQLVQQQPAAYKSHPKIRLLASVYKCITQLVPANPNPPISVLARYWALNMPIGGA